ncbi:MAG TPA: hypothetical protein VHD32_02475 [Candidatus Didemnitutus sp.]|nr:hypothetical protein [Candidatus Didemnitutus sp.]
METPVQTALRLLAALEEFAAQEGNLLRSLDIVEAVAIQERAAPLVQALGDLAKHPEVAALRPRVGELLARREQNRHFLDTQLERLQSELRRVDEARQRLAGLAPAYRMSTPPVPRFNSAA